MKLYKSVQIGNSWNLSSNDGLISLKRDHDYSDCVLGMDATGPFWIAGFCEIYRGSVEYILANGRIVLAPRRYFVFIPPRSVVRWRFNGTQQTIRAMLSRTKSPPATSKYAFITEVDFSTTANGTRICVEHCDDPSALALRCKSLLDDSFTESIQIEKIAKQLQTSPTVMGRYFRRDYGLSPIKYRNSLRSLEAAIKLLEDKPITEVFQDVGFADLSRFYKTFKSVTSLSPGQFQPKKSRKTPR